MKGENNMITIKYYVNRKLYNVNEACYINLLDIAKYLKEEKEFIVIDNKTKKDITNLYKLKTLIHLEGLNPAKNSFAQSSEFTKEIKKYF